jgi:menaquinone-dependent protoporphyrinogen oxidase
VIPPGDVGSLDGYDVVIIGSAVYMGHWLDPAKDAGKPVR